MTQSLLSPRPYQTECIDMVNKAWADGMRRPAVVLPTGSGKTVIFAHLATRFIREHGQRVVVLVHRDELADQAIAKIRAVAPQLDVGKVKAGDNDVDADVMVCSVQTLSRDNRLAALSRSQTNGGVHIGLVITDECHHAAAVSYRKIASAFPVRQVGFTATLARGDGVGLGDVWDDVVFQRSVLWMISKGYLVDVRGRSVAVQDLDLGRVKKTGGDYQAGALGAAMISSGAPGVTARAMTEHAPGRRSIVFAPDVASAYATAAALDNEGITCDVVEGNTSRDERHVIYDRFRTGDLRALVSCMVLTEGFDAPWADCAVIARPTQSASLYVQMVGRVLRPWPGKADALVLDMVGASASNRLRTLIDLEPGAVASVRPGERLTDAVLREAEEADQPVSAGAPAFELRHKDLDLFAASRSVWLRTPGGVMFVPVADGQVFLWPRPHDGMWDVGYAPRGLKWKRFHQGLPLEMAMAWAESEAEDLGGISGGFGGTVSSRSASWRTKNQKPSPEQVAMARRWRVRDPETMSRSQLSDAISVAIASARFDKFVDRINERTGRS